LPIHSGDETGLQTPLLRKVEEGLRTYALFLLLFSDKMTISMFMGGFRSMGVRAELTPNPNAIKFSTDKLIFQGDGSISVKAGETSEHEIMNALLKIEGVDNVFGYQNFITVNKDFDTEWENLTPKVEKVFAEYGY